MIPGNLYSGIEWILLGLVNSGQIRGTAAVVKKSLSSQMLTDLEIMRGTYHFRHPVLYVYYTLRVLGNALGVQGSV